MLLVESMEFQIMLLENGLKIENQTLDYFKWLTREHGEAEGKDQVSS